MAQQSRIYRVTNGTNGTSRLVRAITKAQATHHVAKSVFAASIPTADELVNLVKQGVEVEDTRAEAVAE